MRRPRPLGDQQRLTIVQWRARVPRVLFLLAASALSLAGVVSIFRDPPTVRPVFASAGAVERTTAEGLAERFARVYLGTTASPEVRARALAAFGLPSDALDGEAPGRARRQVLWTSIADSIAAGATRTVVTVAADDGARTWFLAVPVDRSPTGRFAVTGAPAVVAAPPVADTDRPPPEVEVDDPALRGVVSRVMRHFLAGDRVDVTADVASGADVELPPTRLALTDAPVTTWIRRPDVLAARVVAAVPDGSRLRLDYELAVTRGAGRWLVRRITASSTTSEVSP